MGIDQAGHEDLSGTIDPFFYAEPVCPDMFPDFSNNTLMDQKLLFFQDRLLLIQRNYQCIFKENRHASTIQEG